MATAASSFRRRVRKALYGVFETLFPALCAGCGDVLMHGEKHLCVNCIADMEETAYSPLPDNPAERRLLGKFPFAAATAVYRYGKDNTVRRVVHAMKFHGNAELCRMMGRQMGLRLMQSGRFDDIDLLVPVPLHWWRRLDRGYNQSELLCRGIGEVLHREVCSSAVVRHRYTKMQSRQSHTNRAGNVEGAFRVRKAPMIEGKHILLVDDVLTTGATLTACAKAIVDGADGVTISVATLSIAQ